MAYSQDWAGGDRAVADFATAAYAPTQIGRTRYMTPEGFMLCEGARLGRTGAMLYTQREMPDIKPGPGSAMITMMRDAAVLFAPETLLSFAGKPVTNDHPPKLLTPKTAKSASVGTILNPRAGEGEDAGWLVGDLLITDAKAIEDVAAGKVQLSSGYDADVEQVGPGIGRQIKIIGNHVALVRLGRAGPGGAIRDHQEKPMATRTFIDRLRTAFKANDEAAFEEELGKAKDEIGSADAGKVVIQVNDTRTAGDAAPKPDQVVFDAALETRFKGIEDGMAKITDAIAALKPATDAKPPAEEDGKEKKPDDDDKDVEKSEAMDAIAKAEILAPGVKVPAMDGAVVKASAVTQLQRTALTVALADSGRKAHVEAVMGGKTADFAKMSAEQVTVVFDAAAALARVSNNDPGLQRPNAAGIPQGRMTAAKYQELIEARRKGQ